MRKLLLVLAVCVAVSCNTATEKKEKTEQKEEVTKKAEALSSDALLKDIATFVDKEVSLKGTVVHVCEHGGKKLHISSTNPDQRVIVFASEDMGKFKRELEGSDIVLSGVVKEKRIDEAYLNEWAAEIANSDHGGEDEEKDAFHKDQENIEKMREQVKASEKGYISKYHIVAKEYNEKKAE